MSHFGAGLSGKKSDVEYIKKPIHQQANNKEELTDEEMQREIQKAILVEEMWIANDKRRGLPETIIKQLRRQQIVIVFYFGKEEEYVNS